MLSLSRSLSSVRNALSSVGIRGRCKLAATQVRLTFQQAAAMALRPIAPEDQALLREIYADAIESQAPLLYTDEQVRAWAALAWLPGVLDASFRDGSGWLTSDGSAFAIRHPEDRLSLLYCRGSASRRGHGRALVDQIEADARAAGVRQLRTEASQFSRPLLERCGWVMESPETILIGGVPFERYRMVKLLRQAQS